MQNLISNIGMRFVIAINRAVIIFLLLLNVCIADSKNKPMRFILDETCDWCSKKGADETISRIKAAGFNVFVPCVWHGRGVTWRSPFKIKEPAWTNNAEAAKNWDPLAYLIKVAHREGIEVHPWFTISDRPVDILSEYHDEGTPDNAFDIHNPDFREFILARIHEVVKEYDVDGINLDYVRSMGVCVSKSCINDYKQVTGRSLLADLEKYKKNSASHDSSVEIDASINDTDDPAFESISNWNAAAVKDIITKSKRIAEDKNIPLSVSTHAGMKILRGQGVDSISAANAGLIDYILHMDYAQKEKIRFDLISSTIAKLKSPSKFVLMVGNYDESILKNISARKANLVADLIRLSQSISKENGNNNIALYQSIYLSDDQIKSIDGVFDGE